MRMPDERTGPSAGVRIANRRLLAALRPAVVVAAQGLVVVLAMGLSPAGAQEVTPVEAEAIGHDGYIYGFPILENYRRLHAAAIDRGGESYVGPLFDRGSRGLYPLLLALVLVVSIVWL